MYTICSGVNLLVRIALVLPLVGDRDEALYARRRGSGKRVKTSPDALEAYIAIAMRILMGEVFLPTSGPRRCSRASSPPTACRPLSQGSLRSVRSSRVGTRYSPSWGPGASGESTRQGRSPPDKR